MSLWIIINKQAVPSYTFRKIITVHKGSKVLYGEKVCFLYKLVISYLNIHFEG